MIEVINKARSALLESAQGLQIRGCQSLRIARIRCLLDTHNDASCYNFDCLITAQQSDGGWSDVEETVWCTKLLGSCGKTHIDHYNKGMGWLTSMQHSIGGWGLTSRDMPRIPITSLVLTLMPQLATEPAFSWLENQWMKDFNVDVRLTYKGGFTLIAFGRNSIQPQNPYLIKQTLNYLANEQNDDGGFGPWKNHPIGSDPWSTGVILVGLTSYPDLVDKVVVERAVEWLYNNQLPSGYWRYHFIDEGSAYAYWGLTEALKYLGEL